MKYFVKTLISLTWIITLTSCHAPPGHASLSRLMVGTWRYESPQFTATTTCRSNRTFVGHIVPAEGEAFDVSGTWRISDGCMISTVTNSTLPEAIAVGYCSTDRLISVTSKERIFHDGKRTIREVRVR